MNQSTAKTSFAHAGYQRGLSLVELMISITIGLIILTSLTTLFVNQSKARAELDKSNRMIDNGRYALELLSGSLELAGFYGSYSPLAGVPAAVADPCDTTTLVDAANNLDVLRQHVQGYDAANKDSEIAGPPCSLSYTASDNDLKLKSGSDILVVRRAATLLFAQNDAFIQPPPSPQVAAPNNGTIYLQVSSCLWGSVAYRISSNVAALTLGQRNITGLDNCVYSKPATAPYAELRPFLTEIYFVSPNNNPGDGIPTLKRRELSAVGGAPGFVTIPLVEGVEYMQVEYGVDDPALDTDGVGGVGLDGVADAYTTCAACTPEQWSNVVSVKLHLVARNIDKSKDHSDKKTYSLGMSGGLPITVGPFNDQYKRHAYTRQVRLVNPAGRKEAP